MILVQHGVDATMFSASVATFCAWIKFGSAYLYSKRLRLTNRRPGLTKTSHVIEGVFKVHTAGIALTDFRATLDATGVVQGNFTATINGGPPKRPKTRTLPVGSSWTGLQNTPIQIFIIENRVSKLTSRLTATTR